MILVVVANQTADLFLSWGVATIAVGSLVFAATFPLRDWMHRFGRSAVYGMIAGGVLASWGVAFTVGTPPRIILASCVALLLAEAADTEIFHRMTHASWMARAMGSTAVSAPLDTLLFTLIAFGGVLSWASFGSLLLGETALKIGLAWGVLWLFRR